MLEVTGLEAGYGTVPVLRNVNLSVAAGEILLVAGENGAGKTTLARAIAGMIKSYRGAIRLNGEDVAGLKPERLVAKGLRLVLDGHRVFPDIPVRDNLRLGAAVSSAPFDDTVAKVLEVFPILKEKWLEPARGLSGGQQQMLALGQAFCAQPKVLICDEPSMGLAQALLPQILGFLKGWAATGTAIVIIEQHVQAALEYADRAVLVERGTIVLEAPATNFREHLKARWNEERTVTAATGGAR